MRSRFDRPPATVLVAGDLARIEQNGVPVGQSVVRFSVMPESPRVLLGRTVEAQSVGSAQFLPDPPMIIGPNFVEIAVAVPEQKHLAWPLNRG